MRIKYSQQGDTGETSLMGGQRVPKYDSRVETYGTIDEASSALGIARACAILSKTKDIIFSIQKDLVILCAELATLPEDSEKYSYVITEKHVKRLERIIDEMQADVIIARKFVYPGAALSSASIDLARAIIRRGERKAVRLMKEQMIANEQILCFLNRLADLLFTLARYEDHSQKELEDTGE